MVQAPPTPATFADATWDDIAPWYSVLAERPLATAADVEGGRGPGPWVEGSAQR